MTDSRTANPGPEFIQHRYLGNIFLGLAVAAVMILSARALTAGFPVLKLSLGLLAGALLCWTAPRLRLALLFLASIPSHFYSITAWGSEGQDYSVELAMVIPWLLLLASLRELRVPISRPFTFFFGLCFMALASGLKAVFIQDSSYLFPVIRGLVSFSTYLVILVVLYSLWRKDDPFETPPRWIAWIVAGLSVSVLLQLFLHLMGFEVFWGLVAEHNLRSRVSFLPLRSGGWMGSPEDVGVLIGFLFPLAHYYFGLRRSRRSRAIFSLLVLTALLAAQSRTGLGFFTIYFLTVVLFNRSFRRRVGAMVGGLAAAGIFFLAFQHSDLLTENIAHQISWRGDAQIGGMQILLHSPVNVVLGIGPSYGILGSDTSLDGIGLGRQVVLARNSASSDFINTWLFTGLGGLLVLLSLWIWTFNFLYSRREDLESNLFTALLSMAVALFLNSLISETLSRPFLGLTMVSFSLYFYFAYLLLLKKFLAPARS